MSRNGDNTRLFHLGGRGRYCDGKTEAGKPRKKRGSYLSWWMSDEGKKEEKGKEFS